MQDAYDQLHGYSGFKKKLLPALNAAVSMLLLPLVALFMAAIAALLTIPFIIALWTKPQWVAQKLSHPTDTFDSTKTKILFSVLALFSTIIAPVFTVYQSLRHKIPETFKRQSVEGLTRAEKRNLFVNIVTITAVLLTFFPPAGIAIAIAGCAKAASATHLSSIGLNGSSLFIMFSQLGSLLISYVTGKTYDYLKDKNCCSTPQEHRDNPPSPASSPRSTPAFLSATFNPSRTEPAPASSVAVVATSTPPRRLSLSPRREQPSSAAMPLLQEVQRLSHKSTA